MKFFFTLFSIVFSISIQAQIVTISQIQETTDPSGVSPYVWQTVQTTGVVTASAEEGNLGFVFIQEEGATEWGGIQLTGNPDLANLKIGDRVSLQGTVQENSGFTILNTFSEIEILDSNVAISPLDLDPDYFSSASFTDLEKYESMYVQLIKGADSVYVVDPNVGFGDYRIGTDISSASTGCLVLAGRVTSSIISSLNVSYVSDSIYATNSGTMLVPVIEVQTGDAFTSVRGIVTYGFSDYRVIPRNNADFGDVSTRILEIPAGKLLVYPNPSNGSVRIENLDSGVITVTNSSGQVVFEKNTVEQVNSELDLSYFDKGIYFVSFTSENKISRAKLVIN